VQILMQERPLLRIHEKMSRSTRDLACCTKSDGCTDSRHHARTCKKGDVMHAYILITLA